MRCPICKTRTTRVGGEDKIIAEVPHYQRRHECPSCVDTDGYPFRFTTDERPINVPTPAGGGQSRNSAAEAQVSSSPDGAMCITIMVPPDASPGRM
jgi:hypothetical protein